MEKTGRNINYFDYAENDFLYWEDSLKMYQSKDEEEKIYVPNSICWNAANIAERYLKYMLDIVIKENFVEDSDILECMKIHNLGRICENIMKFNENIEFKLHEIRSLSHYYYDVRYPGDNSYYVKQEDIDFCYKVLTKIRNICLEVKEEYDKKTNKETEECYN